MASTIRAPKSTRWAARSAASRVRRNGASRSTISPSMARSKACTTTAFAIFRRRTSAASTAMSATGTTAANFTQYGRRRQQFRRGGDGAGRTARSNIGARPTPRRRPPPTSVGYVNLTGKVEATPTWTIEGAAHVRAFEQKTVDGNPTDTQPCAPIRRCFASATTATPANGLNGLSSPIPSRRRHPGRDRSDNDPFDHDGVSLQATNTDQLFGHDNHFVVGTSFDSSVTRFAASAELGTIGPNYVVSGSGIFLGPPAIRFRSARSRCAPPTSTPGSMRSTHSTSPRRSRSRAAAGSTTRASSCRTRSAPRSTAITRSTASIRSSAAPTRSRRT